MNTTTAAAKAGVTIPTIRTWCRQGVVTAVKASGRWIVDTASLASRIAIGALRATRRKAATVNATPDYAALADEARALANSLTPKKGCHPADLEGGSRDRASGTLKARRSAIRAAASFDLAAEHAAITPATELSQWQTREHYDHGIYGLEAARTATANIRSIG